MSPPPLPAHKPRSTDQQVLCCAALLALLAIVAASSVYVFFRLQEAGQKESERERQELVEKYRVKVFENESWMIEGWKARSFAPPHNPVVRGISGWTLQYKAKVVSGSPVNIYVLDDENMELFKSGERKFDSNSRLSALSTRGGERSDRLLVASDTRVQMWLVIEQVKRGSESEVAIDFWMEPDM